MKRWLPCLEEDFNQYLKENRHGKFEYINDIFYENMKQGIKISRFKLYLADLLKIKIKESVQQETHGTEESP